jgi:hypothetical protein
MFWVLLWYITDDSHITPTATETVLPWKRGDEEDKCAFPVKQQEFPPWCSNKDYMTYNSPSTTFLGEGVIPYLQFTNNVNIITLNL